MTTVCFKDGIMASDSKCSDGHTFLTRCQKIYRLANGALVGTAGDADARELMELLGKCTWRKLPTRAALAETKTFFHGILAFPNGKVFMVYVEPYDIGPSDSEWSGSVVEMEEKFCAVGSGWEFAIGAMAAGRSAAEAVHVACRYDSHTQAPVREVPLKQVKAKKAA